MNDGKMVLRFEPDAKTELPHLVDPGGCLSAAVRSDWEAELKGRCTAQSLRGGETITFATRPKNLPNQFRVRAEYGSASNRMPSYVLEPVEAPPARAEPPVQERSTPNSEPAPAPTPTPRERSPTLSTPTDLTSSWPIGFLFAARKLANASEADRMGRLGLQFVLEELDDLALGHPEELLVLLVSAYTATRKLACNGNPSLAREEQFYDRALEALDTPLLSVAAESHMGPLSSLIGAVSRCFGLRNDA